MNFNSFHYFEFLIVILIIHKFLRSARHQNIFLLSVSYFFYACWDWRFLSLIIFSTIVDFINAQNIEKNRSKAKYYLGISLFINLGILFSFKYFNFFQQGFFKLTSLLGFEASPFLLEIILPVGISFYTFQSLSYVIDVYRKEIKASDSFFTYALYISFFPQLVAGPIERSTNLLPQFQKIRTTTKTNFYSGMELILIGLYKKVVIADVLASFASGLTHPENHSGINMLFTMYAFTFQVYGDFSGYSNIARGSAKLLGIDLMENFKRPFSSVNIQEFWGRWHISLSEWIRSYLFFPLMRSRFFGNHISINVFLAMLITGVWHGAGAKYILFGSYHGLLLVLFENTRKIRKKIRPTKKSPFKSLYSKASTFFTFHLVVIAFSIFGCKYSSDLPIIYKSLYSVFEQNINWNMIITFSYLTIPLSYVHRYFEIKNSGLQTKTIKILYPAVCIFMITSIVIHGVIGADPFIYFQF